MAAEKILSYQSVTEEEVNQQTNTRGPRRFKWEYPEEIFDGEWYAIEVPNNKVTSALNSYRNQSQSVYGTRASCFRGDDGRLYVRRLVDQPVEPRSRT